MSDLTEFLLARIAEDEDRAQCVVITDDQSGHIPLYFEGRMLFRHGSVEATEDQWRELMASFGAIRVDDPRLLAECEAKRRIVMRCGMVLDSWDHVHDGTPDLAPFPDVNRRERHHADETLYDLAAAFADHPDYRQEWKP